MGNPIEAGDLDVVRRPIATTDALFGNEQVSRLAIRPVPHDALLFVVLHPLPAERTKHLPVDRVRL